MKTYVIDPSIYGKLKANFGMAFFHREENGKILIKPLSKRILDDMKEFAGSINFKLQKS